MVAEERTPPERFLIPIEGLRVPLAWPLGRVVIHPGQDAENLIADAPPFGSRETGRPERVQQILRAASGSSVAEITGAADIEDALDAVRAALDALRLFQLSRRVTATSSFGLAGDLFRSRIEYVAVWQQSAAGSIFRGDPAGWEFSAAAFDEWHNSHTFTFLGKAIGDPGASEGARRASIGTQLLARAATEHRPDLKMLGVASALEAWLLRRSPGAQTFRLARHVSWFGCGVGNEPKCGRDRDVCPYLRLDPQHDGRRLRTLRELGNTHMTWRCSEWHRVMDWYAARSDAAHGDPTAVASSHASEAEYWVTHYLAVPILDWLRTHPDDPIGVLEAELTDIGDPPGWSAMVAALDATISPVVPPAADS